MKNRKASVIALCAVMSLSCVSMTACATNAQAAETTVTAQTSASTAESDAQKPDMKDQKDPLQSLVDSGKISQTTYEAIQKYMKENMPEMKEGESRDDKQTPPAKPEGDNSDQKKPDQKPDKKPDASANESTSSDTQVQGQHDGHQGPGGPGMGGGMMMNEELLKKMLEANVITEAEYNTIKDAMPQPPEKPAEESTSSKS